MTKQPIRNDRDAVTALGLISHGIARSGEDAAREQPEIAAALERDGIDSDLLYAIEFGMLLALENQAWARRVLAYAASPDTIGLMQATARKWFETFPLPKE